MRHPIVLRKSSVGASYSIGFISSSCFAFLADGLEMKQFRSSLPKFVAYGEAMILTRQIHQLLEVIVVVLYRRPGRSVRGSDFTLFGAHWAVVSSATVSVVPLIYPLVTSLPASHGLFTCKNCPYRVLPISELGCYVKEVDDRL
jgi:formate-dependent nitrite reductase membrane component NrfD